MSMQYAALAAAGIAGIYLFSQQGKKKVVVDSVTDNTVANTNLPAANPVVDIKNNETVVATAIVDRPTSVLVVIPESQVVGHANPTRKIIVPGEKAVAKDWSIELTNNMGQIMTGQGRVFTARVLHGTTDVTWTVDMVFSRPDGSIVYQAGGSKILLTPDVPGLWTVKIRAGGGGHSRQERDIPFRVYPTVAFLEGLTLDHRVNNVVNQTANVSLDRGSLIGLWE